RGWRWPRRGPTSWRGSATSGRRATASVRATSTACASSAAACRRGVGRSPKTRATAKGSCWCTTLYRRRWGKGRGGGVPLLFCGKTTLADIKTLAQLVDEGLVTPPRFVPPQFADLHALSAWMCFAHFLNRLSLKRIEGDYAGLF